MSNSIEYVFLGFAVLVVIFMIFSGRRNRKRQAEQRAQIVPGVEVMTNFGLFGKLLSIDEATNVAEIETKPGTVIRVHRQTITKVVTADEMDPNGPRSVEEAMEIANREQAEREANAKIDSEAPQYGERTDDPITKATTPAAKRAPRAPKKTGTDN